MDTVLAEAITKITALPPEAQREIAVQLLGQETVVSMPVIEFEV